MLLDEITTLIQDEYILDDNYIKLRASVYFNMPNIIAVVGAATAAALFLSLIGLVPETVSKVDREAM